MKSRCHARRIATYATIALSLCGVTAHADTLFAADHSALSSIQIINPLTMRPIGSVHTLNAVTGLAANSESNFFVSEGSTIKNIGVAGNVINTHTAASADHFYDLSLSGTKLYAVDNTTQGIYGVVILNAATLTLTGSIQIDMGFIRGLAAGPSNDVYVSAGHQVLHYSTGENLLGSHTFPSTDYVDDLFLRGRVLYGVKRSLGVPTRIVSMDSTTLAVLGSFPVSGAVNGLSGNSVELYGSIGSDVFKFDAAGNVVSSYKGFSGDAFYDLAFVKTAVP